MTRNHLVISLLTACLSTLLPAALSSAQAAETKPKAPTTATPAETTVYGSQLMTDKERTELRARMWAAQTDEERNRIQAEHHEAMKKRAQERGVTLADMPPSMPAGQKHHGGGMGPGGGMGAGKGMGACGASAPSCPASGPCTDAGQHCGKGSMKKH